MFWALDKDNEIYEDQAEDYNEHDFGRNIEESTGRVAYHFMSAIGLFDPHYQQLSTNKGWESTKPLLQRLWSSSLLAGMIGAGNLEDLAGQQYDISTGNPNVQSWLMTYIEFCPGPWRLGHACVYDLPGIRHINLAKMIATSAGSTLTYTRQPLKAHPKSPSTSFRYHFHKNSVKAMGKKLAPAEDTGLQWSARIKAFDEMVQEGLKIMTADHNEIGWTHPNSKITDAIWLLQGCSLPVVLRQASGMNRWRVVGQAYLLGLMDGERWRKEQLRGGCSRIKLVRASSTGTVALQKPVLPKFAQCYRS